MARLRNASIVVAILLVVVGCGRDTGERGRAAPAASGGPSSLLFAVRGDGSIDGTRLRIIPGPDEVSWFTDRPERRAGRIRPEAFVDSWVPFGLADDPPNALLVTSKATVPVELADARWDAAGAAVELTAEPIGGAVLPTGALGRTELFVDDVEACTTDPLILTFTNPPPGTTVDEGDCFDLIELIVPTVDAAQTAAEQTRSKRIEPGDESDVGMPTIFDFPVELFGYSWTCNTTPWGTTSCNASTPAGASNIFISG